MSDIDVKILKLVTFSHKYLLRKGVIWETKRWCVRKRVVTLARQQGLGNSIRTHYPLCFKKQNGICPLPWGQNVPVNIYALSTPISVLFSGVHAYQVESSTGGHLIIISPEFDGRGCGSSILEISSLCEQKLVLFFGARFFLFCCAK